MSAAAEEDNQLPGPVQIEGQQSTSPVGNANPNVASSNPIQSTIIQPDGSPDPTAALSLSETHSAPLVPTSSLSTGPSSTSVVSAENDPNPTLSSDGRLSNSTVTGIVVGVAAGAALITFLVTYFLMRSHKSLLSRKRRFRSKKRSNFPPSGIRLNHIKGPEQKEWSSRSEHIEVLLNSLPQSSDDRTIRSRISTLFEHIELHVENYYREIHVSISEDDESKLARFNSPYLPGPVTAIFPQATNSQLSLMKHCLTQYILSSISSTGRPEQSFLRREFALVPNAIEMMQGNRPQKPAFDEVLSLWRVLSDYLVPTGSEGDPDRVRRNRCIRDSAETFCNAFSLWMSPNYQYQDQVRSLTKIMNAASDLGMWLFAQPAAFEFRWQNPGQESAGPRDLLVVMPAVFKVTDDSGRKLSAGQLMIERVTTRIQSDIRRS